MQPESAQPQHAARNGQSADPPDTPVARVLATVASRIAEPQRTLLDDFVRRYFAQVAAEDLAERDPADLYGAVLSHLSLARRRDPGQTRVRVYNPTLAEHGWRSTHTIVEIVTDDMPFLVDSVSMELQRHGLRLHLFIHPQIDVDRAPDGTMAGLRAAAGEVRATRTAESFMHVEVDQVPDAAGQQALADDLTRVLAEVRAAVHDWPAMRERVAAILRDLDREPPPIDAADLAEGRAFLEWINANHFTFLGARTHDLVDEGGTIEMNVVPDSSLGILRLDAPKERASGFSALPPELRADARRPTLLVVTKSAVRSTVHRPGYLDSVGVKRFDAQGRVVGEHRFLGLFTSTAYNAPPAQIPLLRLKTAEVIARSGLHEQSHSGKALANILLTYPRDELFQIGVDELQATANGILHLGERQRFRLFVRRDPYGRFVSCLVYAPRDRYNTEVRRRWQDILMRAFQGTGTEFDVQMPDSGMARVHLIVRTNPDTLPADTDVKAVERALDAATRTWQDELDDALVAALGESRGSVLRRRYAQALPAGYREQVPARAAVADIEMIESLRAQPDVPFRMRMYRPLEAPAGMLRFKIVQTGAPLTLSASLPLFERLGLQVLDEQSSPVRPDDGEPVWLHDFGLQLPPAALHDGDVDMQRLRPLFEEAFAALLSGRVEVDDFNRLVVLASVPVDDVVVLRAYAKYLRQIGFALSQSFIEQTLAAHPGIARALLEHFSLRFAPRAADAAPDGNDGADGADSSNGTDGAHAPDGADDAAEAAHAAAIGTMLDAVSNLNEDRVLRQLLALIQATTRTNFWRRDADGARRTFLSFKFDPARVPELPQPRPMFEIFVYSTRFEGVHLRGGRVARGGLRWSDRPEDFRTEVLGLVKAQIVKNTVIVPVGSKGGFVLKMAPPAGEREALLAEGIACYRNFLRGLLDLTDNRDGESIVPPPQVRRRDGDDPYLVVAADKGTATFSDHANAVSAEYGFWLGDAFASGGSDGYDHKAMGITARGAWESTKRHFREIGHDTQTTDFTVAGIGDMSGDVFGNGMLLSPHIRLVAAFDHRHVFLDPDPDAATSFAERQRLFALPRSSWDDYDRALLSAGGAIVARGAKSVTLSPQVRQRLAIGHEQITPTELVRAILKAPVDLLYNGGIGTYVKAASESHAQVGDRANDAVRVDGRELRARVVTEGGNLGLTMLGRIEFARNGGRIYTDAIDNSAGVDTSDHEVNIKILLGLPVAHGELTGRQRNALLPQMTDEVAALVLRDNYGQTGILSADGRQAPALLDAQQRFIHFLERDGRLNRELEYLPSDELIAERRERHEGLAAPERAVLLAYSKIWLYDELQASPLPDDTWVAGALTRYFPRPMRESFAGWMPQHPLRREIIATHVVNSMINRVGSTFVHRVCESTGAMAPDVVRAYLLARETFGFVALWQQIEALDNRMPDALQSQMVNDARQPLEQGTLWFLRSPHLHGTIDDVVGLFRPAVQQLADQLPQLLPAEVRDRLERAAQQWIAQGAPADLAHAVLALPALVPTLDIAEVARACDRPIEQVARVHFSLSGELGVDWLREKIDALPSEQHWQMLAKGAMLDDLSGLLRSVVGAALTDPQSADEPADVIVQRWGSSKSRVLQRSRQLLAELKGVKVPDSAMLSVTLRELRRLA